MPIEFDDEGLRIIGAGVKGIRFFDAARQLKREIYLKQNGLLNIESSGSATATSSGAPSPHAMQSVHHTGAISATQHGALAGGDLHAVATTGSAGFMSAADKSALDNLIPGFDTATYYAESFLGQGGGWADTVNGIGAPAPPGDYGYMVIKTSDVGWTYAAYGFRPGGVVSDGNWAVYKWGGTAGATLSAIVDGAWIEIATLPEHSVITPTDATGYSAEIDGALVTGFVIGCGGIGQRFDAVSIDGVSAQVGDIAIWVDDGKLGGESVITATQHGAQPGGTLHSVATSGSAGFMATTDKVKLDSLPEMATGTNAWNYLNYYQEVNGAWTNAETGGLGAPDGVRVTTVNGDYVAYQFNPPITSNGNWKAWQFSAADGEIIVYDAAAPYTPHTLVSRGAHTLGDYTGYDAGIDGVSIQYMHISAHLAAAGMDAFGLETGSSEITIASLAGFTSGSALGLLATLTDTLHGARGGGSLHSAATSGSAGFMSASDKSKLDGVAAGAAVGGSGSAGQVALWSSGSVLSGSAALPLANLPAHKSTHAAGGSDALTAADIGAISGSGATNQVAYFSSASALTSGSGFAWNGQWLGVGVGPTAGTRVYSVIIATDPSASQNSAVTGYHALTYTADTTRYNHIMRTLMDIVIPDGITQSGYERAATWNATRYKSTDAGTLAELSGMVVAVGHESSMPAAGARTTTAAYGVRINTYGAKGTITSLYALYIAARVTGGTVTNDWAIYSLHTGPSYLAGNLLLGATAAGTSATRTLAILSGTAPAGNITDGVQVYSADVATGDAGLHVRSEDGTVSKIANKAQFPNAVIGGDTTNGAELNPTDGLILRGTATVWDDLRVEPVARSTGSKSPTFGTVGLGGLYVYQFDNAAAGSEKELYYNVQMTHAWASTGIYIHVHWLPLTAESSKVVRWGLEYSWASPGQTFPSPSTVYATTIVTGATGTQYSHIITAFSVLTPSASQNGLSAILMCRLFRDSANAADTYTGTAGLLYIDAHIEINKLGSATEYA